ncbi:c-type cytochrome, partial [Propylenella binzhouense]
MRRVVLIVAAVLALQGVGAVLFAYSGLYNVAASAGHWPITRWFLHMAMESSVRTYSYLAPEPPPLDDPALVARGLGHYAGGCEPCHGAPGDKPTAISRGMVPVPPFLPSEVAKWSPEELFRLVKHGLKFTGMPAWLTQRRDDEIWAMVAFLEAMPGMPLAEYRARAEGEAVLPGGSAEETAYRVAALGDVGTPLVACARCHGFRGQGGGAGAFPRLAGQKADYLLQALRDYATGARPSGIMRAVAAELTDAERAKLAAFYAAQKVPPAPAGPAPAPELLARG